MGKAKTPAENPSHNLDEMNVARLSLISMQRQVSDDYTSWEMHQDVDGVPIRIHCGSSVQVPHGIDTEVYLAILKLYQLMGCPSDGEVSATPHELMRTAGIHPTARNYTMVRNSLIRLNRAIYQIDQGWRDFRGMRWHSVTFQHLAKLEYTKNEEHHLDTASIIKITLPQDTVKSIQAGYLNPISYQLLGQIRQPSTVALCRTLEALRRDPSTTQVVQDRIEFPLLQWARTLRLEESRPDNIRRSLKNAHEELMQAKYIRTVDYVGKGMKQVIVYDLYPQMEDQALEEQVQLLADRGVALGSARTLIAEFPDRIQDAIKRFDQLKAGGYPMKTPGGLLVSIIKNPANYEPADPTVKKALPAQTPSGKQKPSKKKADELPAPSVSEEERIRDVLFLLKSHLSVAEQDVLTHLLQTGKISLDSFHGELMGHLVKHELPKYAADLKASLRQQYFQAPVDS
ncbi:replication initiator protein A [Deinococcus cellulosilyticus]|uniref:Replication initiator protein A n=1 Tax=Deinococcus cellulosilyticus (strain DSM 18568 / NBRC 106333 / KACC 11606 / 5516J-15) TaxID=1223518 RepID=A0A511NAC7_DEIC1|nr:replication initiator protein A [Deinococcus cellulosilyticus]GEM49785.1 hypothetical protein DC3_54200 [Deinococcus cellulosilyticus NBRC 106333 = KACC 11606]